MNRFFRHLLIIIVANIVAGFLFCLPVFFASDRQYDAVGWLLIGLVLTCISLFVQLIIGLVFINRANKKELGQAMLLAVAIFLLVGFSICSGMW